MTRAEQKAATRSRILQGALNIFAERGFDSASIRDIAAEAGINHGLIRYYFADKDGLWKAAVAFLFERMHDELHTPQEEYTWSDEDQLKAWIRRYVHYCARHPEHARIMVQESIRDSDRLAWAVEKFIKPDHEALRGRFEARVKQGFYPDIPFHSYVYMFTAAAQSPFMLAEEVKRVHGVDVTHESVVNAHADALYTFFIKRQPDG